MKKFFLFILILLISNCTLNKVVKHHGVHFLDKKQQKLTISASNKNDVIALLGPPSTKSTFDNDIWIYIERKKIESSILRKKDKFIVNNVLIVEINNKGILVKKDFFNIDKLNNYKFSEDKTVVKYSKESFVYDFLSSVRQKIDAPIKKQKKK